MEVGTHTRGVYTSLVPEGGQPGVEESRHWTDVEVLALLCVWADQRVRDSLKSTLHNKYIFQEISSKLERTFGVVRNWKQCRTKYKNLKYDYKVAKSNTSSPGKYMKFFHEVEAILLDRGLDEVLLGMKKKFYDKEKPTAALESEVVIEIDHCDLFIPPTGTDLPPVDHLNVVTMSDAGRNWSDHEISNRLMQQGIERDWKQCHTKAMGSSVESGQIAMLEGDTYAAMDLEDRNCRSESVSPIHLGGTPQEDQGLITGRSLYLGQWYPPDPFLEQTESGPTHGDTLSTGKGRKRKADDAASHLTPVKKIVENVNIKQEETHIPIIEVHSVCSLANQDPETKFCSSSKRNMASKQELNIGKKLNEGKTKQIFEIVDQPGLVLVQSKDQITAGNAVRKDQMEGKAAIANKTTSCVFGLLQESGIKTAFVRQHSDTAFVGAHCEMIPIEWVCRRVATGSFLKRNPGVKEGYRFSPLKMEIFFKDDANNDPQWSEEQLLEAKFCLAGLAIGRCEVDIMNRSTVAIFEILEKAWATQNCTLVDMKIEFGVNIKTQEIVLADVIDNDSWRLWPAGDRSQQKDKQVYRDLKEVTPEAMQMVKRNFEWVSERVKLLLESKSSGRVVVLMGSTSDLAHSEKIKKACTSYGIPCVLRVTSAHKGPDETLRIKAEYEGDGIPTVFVAVAGRSNGLGPVMSGNTAYPVINCPPITPDWGSQDVWSSLRLPSGLGCSTILSPDAAAQFAAQIFGLTNHLVWCKLRASMLNTWVGLKVADKKLQACTL
ncbi:bifunctional phosphoribosylaminoimidazole carboxylase/phosphoribosylaminoimidazole succinocarboxamide synthetase isoform X6 [Stigmatopora argus]